MVVIFGIFTSKIEAAISFTISNPVVNSSDEIEVDALITGLTSSSNCSTDGCYLQAEILSAGGIFGMTYNNSGEYVDFFQPSSAEEIKSKLFNFKPVDGVWSGKLKAKNNPESENYYGPGEYAILFRRFTGNSKTPTSGDSNTLSVSLSAAAPTPTPPPAAESTPVPTQSPTPLTLKTAPPTPEATKTPSPAPVKSLTPKSKATPLWVFEEASSEAVLGISDTTGPTPKEEIPVETKSKIPIFAIILIVVGIAAIGVSLFLAYEKNKTSPPDSLV